MQPEKTSLRAPSNGLTTLNGLEFGSQKFLEVRCVHQSLESTHSTLFSMAPLLHLVYRLALKHVKSEDCTTIDDIAHDSRQMHRAKKLNAVHYTD